MKKSCCSGSQTCSYPYTSEFLDTSLAYYSSLDVFAPHLPHRATGIVCTIGPACNNVEMISKMIKAGMCIARFNFSHGKHEDHAKMMQLVREATNSVNPLQPVALALDTKGPEIRTGMNKDNASITLIQHQTLILTTDDAFKDSCTADKIYLDYKSLAQQVKKGQIVLLADGNVELVVDEIRGSDVVCKVISGSTFGSKKNACLPLVKTNLPTLSQKDHEDIKFGIAQKVDIIFASFIRNADNVRELRSILDQSPDGKNIKIISKIENFEGIHNIKEILEVSDGIMIARGDMGMDIEISRVNVAQKKLSALALCIGKPVICATQMLESMIEKSRPTRSEISDVTNAVTDGVDCVMLSGESANGKYPLEAVTTMGLTCLAAEKMVRSKRMFEEVSSIYTVASDAHAVAMAAVQMSYTVQASAIVTLSTTGKTAHLLSLFRPLCPIICVTRYPHVARGTRLYRGVFPILYTEQPISPWSADVDRRLKYGIMHAQQNGFISSGAKVVFVTGWKSGPGSSNCVRIATLDSKCSFTWSE